MSSNGTLGSLLQGVSQQPQMVRAEGTVTEQVNFSSDVVQGLTVRPALHERGTILNHAITDYKFLNLSISGTDYILGYSTGLIAMWDTAGVPQTVLAPLDGTDAPLDYIGTEMQPYVFGDTLYISNRDVVVEKSTIIDTSDVFLTGGIALCLGGKYARKYTLRLRYADDVVLEHVYTTPDGDTAGDSAKVTSSYIIEQLYDLLLADPAKKASTTLYHGKGTLFVRDDTVGFTLSTSDDEDGSTMRSFTSATDDFEDLSETAAHGMLVRVSGSDEGDEDDVYMRFNSDVTTVLGDGLGDRGVWEEWYEATAVSALDLTTMPHVLEKTGPTEFTLKKGSWYGRRVGSDTTNPFPDFVGQRVRDLSGFQSRLVMAAGPACCMSRSNEPLDFFKESTFAELDTDPISIKSTEDGNLTLDWIIPFDRDLVFMSDPGAGQFIITGGGKITPTNASLVKTTAFEMRGGAKPVETGRTILFPYKSGVYSGIKEFFTNDQVATNGADTTTETADRYIVGLVNHMQCSTNFNLAVFKTDSIDHLNTVWAYKYLWTQTEKLQSSWSKWVFPHTVRHFYFTGSELLVVMEAEAAEAGKVDYIFASLDLDTPVNAVTGYHLCLDRQASGVVSVASAISLPYSGADFVQGDGCLTPGRQVTAATEGARSLSGHVTYTFDPATVPAGATVYGGLKYARWVKPTMPFARGRDGKPLTRTRLVVNGFMLEYEETGYIKATMNSIYRADPIDFIVDWFDVDEDPANTSGIGLRSGILHVPWGERSDWSELTIYSDDVRPTTLLEIEWTGQVFKGSRE